MTDNSTAPARARKQSAKKPKKPHRDFALTPTTRGYWVKKIHGVIHQFGRWGRVVDGVMVRLEGDGADAALIRYLEQKDDLHAGREPQVAADQLTVGKLCRLYLESLHTRLKSGALSPIRFSNIQETVDLVLDCFGKTRAADSLRPADFAELRAKFPKSWNVVTEGSAIRRVRAIFNFATNEDNDLLERRVRFGSDFREPSKSEQRRHKERKKDKYGEHFFKPEELHALLSVASVPLKAMLLLGLNAGFGNTDIALLPFTRLDLDNGWLDWPRPKTGIVRRCKLWPETITAIQAAWMQRPLPRDKEDHHLVFLTHHGHRWVRSEQVLPNPKKPNKVLKTGIRFQKFDAIGNEFRKLLVKAEVPALGRGFYTLRHTFRTVADNAGDNPAARLVMGHTDGSIDDTYRGSLWSDRLEKLSDYVRAWFRGGRPADAKRQVKRVLRLGFGRNRLLRGFARRNLSTSSQK